MLNGPAPEYVSQSSNLNHRDFGVERLRANTGWLRTVTYPNESSIGDLMKVRARLLL